MWTAVDLEKEVAGTGRTPPLLLPPTPRGRGTWRWTPPPPSCASTGGRTLVARTRRAWASFLASASSSASTGGPARRWVLASLMKIQPAATRPLLDLGFSDENNSRNNTAGHSPIFVRVCSPICIESAVQNQLVLCDFKC